MAASSSSRGKSRALQNKGTFVCEKCGLSASYCSFGTSHPFTKAFVLLEPAFVSRDPFSPIPQPLILGSHCVSCNKTVCVSPACSVFYTKRFCLECVQENLEEFPQEIQQEALKEIQKSEETN